MTDSVGKKLLSCSVESTTDSPQHAGHAPRVDFVGTALCVVQEAEEKCNGSFMFNLL